MSPLQRTIKEQKILGRRCGIVERFISNRRVGGGVRSDLFGLFDLISISEDDGIVGVQACGPDFSAHYKKIAMENSEMAQYWLRCGGKIELWGWRKLLMKRGGKKKKYYPRLHQFTMTDLRL